jgi:hypothetical protein
VKEAPKIPAWELRNASMQSPDWIADKDGTIWKGRAVEVAHARDTALRQSTSTRETGWDGDERTPLGGVNATDPLV